jgi:hypothetical protein
MSDKGNKTVFELAIMFMGDDVVARIYRFDGMSTEVTRIPRYLFENKVIQDKFMELVATIAADYEKFITDAAGLPEGSLKLDIKGDNLQ